MNFRIDAFAAGVVGIFIIGSTILEEEFFLLRSFSMMFACLFLIKDFFGLSFLRENIATMI